MSVIKNTVCASFILMGALFAQGAGASEIRVGFSQDAITLDPANHRKRETETIIRNMYDGLLTRTARMKVVAQLAESWRQIDPVTYEFTLRSGISFHNGELLTSEDIKFTFERLTKEGAMEGMTSPRQSLLPDIARIEIVDARTLRFYLREAWPQLPAMLPLQEVVSRKFVEANRASGKLGTMANGTGPFKLVEWRPGEAIVMERFEGYYGGAAEIPPVGKACVERVTFQVMPDNDERVAALLDGRVDIVNELPASAIATVQQSDRAVVMKAPGTRTFFVALNMTAAPFNDVRVRQAMNHAVQRAQLIDRHLNGGAVAVNGVLSPHAFGYHAHLHEYGYDPEKSRALLAEAGYDAARVMVLETDETMRDLANSIADMLRAGGVKTVVRIEPLADLKKRWRAAGDKGGDMWLTSWGNSSLDPVGIFAPTLRTGGRGNASGYSNAAVDALLDGARQEVDLIKRAKMYGDAQTIVNEQAPWIFLWVPQDLYGVSKRVKGWRPSSDGRINLHDACVQ